MKDIGNNKSKGNIIRRSIPFWLLLSLVLLIPEISQPQTRFFEQGDSGFTGTFDFISVKKNQKLENSWGGHAAFTYKGLFDIGAGLAAANDNWNSRPNPKYVFANFAFLRPQYAGVGLEFRGRYSNSSRDSDYIIPFSTTTNGRVLQTGLRGFYRNSRANLMLGLAGFYRFNKYQYLDASGDVLYGHDFGEWGFALDFHFLVGRIVHFSLRGEYAENKLKWYWNDWALTTTLSVGVMIGLDDPGGKGD